jgi:DNA-binding response OmpR family regulator
MSDIKQNEPVYSAGPLGYADSPQRSGGSITKPKVLLVDDNGTILDAMARLLEASDFEVVPAASVTEALNRIVNQPFDVLITDLHMPGPGDGFSVVTAMRHSQPQALTLVISGYPDVQEAMAAILLQADEVLVKPFDVHALAKLIRKKLDGPKLPRQPKESVATILERDAELTIQRWLFRVQGVDELVRLPLSDDERMQHLPDMTREIVARLREKPLMETATGESAAAAAHGKLRYRQGYTAPLLVQESRILQVCLFETLQRNLGILDFSLVLRDIMLVADEVDNQLTQSIDSFLKCSPN